ncbi:MAG: hypothetical protein AAFN65_13670, partial [Bacteroidota bacterium]
THQYEESGSYEVSLFVTDEDGVEEEHKKTIDIQCSNGGLGDLPECTITGPEFGAAGEDLSFIVTGSGAGPFDYDWWSSSTDLNYGSSNGQTALFEVSDYATDGTDHTIYATVIDDYGQESECSYDVQVSGHLPSVNLYSFGSYEVGEYLYLAVDFDLIYTVGVPYFRYIITLGDMQVDDSGWSDPYAAGWEYCGGNGQSCPFTTNGVYKAKVQMRDDRGIVGEAEIDLPIGPIQPQPPAAAIDFVVEDGDTELECGEGLTFHLSGEVPDAPMCSSGEKYVYLVSWIYTNAATGVSETVGTEVFEYQGPCLVNFDELASVSEKYISNQGFDIGTYLITAKIRADRTYPDVQENVATYETPNPLVVDYLYSDAEFEPIELDQSCGAITMSIDGSCGSRDNSDSPGPCGGQQPYKTYEWVAYNPTDGLAITDFFLDTYLPNGSKCVSV